MPNLSKEKFRHFAKGGEDLPLFYQPWYLDIVSGENNWDVVLSQDKGGNITGVFPFTSFRIKGIPVFSNPPLSPYLGIRLFPPKNLSSRTSVYSFENKSIKALIDGLPKKAYYMNFSFHPDFQNWYPFFWRGYRQTTRYTYILKNIKDHESLQNEFSSTLKRQIKKATENLQLVEDVPTGKLFSFLKSTLQRQGNSIGLSEAMLENLARALIDRGQGKLLAVLGPDQDVLAATLLAWDKESAYCLVLGMDHSADKNNAVKYLLWESIKQTSAHVDYFNFEGSMIKNVERVFRSFGAFRTPYYNISFYKNRIMRALLAFINK